MIDIWLYNEKEIHEQVAPVSNNAVTGSELNNFTSNVASLPGDGCTEDTMCFMALRFFGHSSAYVNSLLSQIHNLCLDGECPLLPGSLRTIHVVDLVLLLHLTEILFPQLWWKLSLYLLSIWT